MFCVCQWCVGKEKDQKDMSCYNIFEKSSTFLQHGLFLVPFSACHPDNLEREKSVTDKTSLTQTLTCVADLMQAD